MQIIKIDTPIPDGQPYALFMGFRFNDKWVAGSEISELSPYKFVDAMHRNHITRQVFSIAQQWPHPCGMWWNDLYGKDIKVTLKDGSVVDLAVGTIVGARSAEGLPVGIGCVETKGLLKFTAVYPDDTYEAGKTGMLDGEKFHIYLDGHMCKEEFVFSSGYKQHEVKGLTIE